MITIFRNISKFSVFKFYQNFAKTHVIKILITNSLNLVSCAITYYQTLEETPGHILLEKLADEKISINHENIASFFKRTAEIRDKKMKFNARSYAVT